MTVSSPTLQPSAQDGAFVRRLIHAGGSGGVHGLGLSGVIHERTEATGHSNVWVVLAPGWAGDRCGPGEIFVAMAAALLSTTRIGHVLRFDVHGRGEAGGEYAESDLDAMVDDGLRAMALPALESGAVEGGNPPPEIHLIGMCSGGNVALGAAGLWARIQAQDETDLRHLPPEVVVALRATKLASVQAISTFPFQEMRPEELNSIRQHENRRKTLAKLFQPESYKKLLSGKLNPTRIMKNWFETEPGAKGSEEAGEKRNLKLSRRDLLDGIGKYSGPLHFLYADGDPEGTASIPVFQAYFNEAATEGAKVESKPSFTVLDGCNHNFYGLSARAKLCAQLAKVLA